MPPNAPNENSSALEELRQKLYANNAPEQFPQPVAHTTPGAPAPVLEQSVWAVEEPKKKVAWSVMFLFGALGVFVLALGVAAYFLVFGGGAISTDNVEVSVAPIPSLRSGDVATLLVTVKNNNPTPMMATKLSVAFPESARSADNPMLAYPRYDSEESAPIGDIAPGAQITRTVRVVLSGAEGEVFSLPLKVEYKTEGSNATFVKDDTHDVTITSSPLSVRVEAPVQATAGQDITLTVFVRSDAPTALENIVVFAEYPFGFIPAKTGLSTTLFEVGTIPSGKEVSVSVRGTLSGEDMDERVFRFKVGTKGAQGTLGVTYAQGQGSVALSNPFLATTFAVNGNRGTDLVVGLGEQVSVGVDWVNSLGQDLTDVQIAVKLAGDVLDPASISASGGFYRSADQTILFGRETNAALARLSPGARGTGSFTFRTKPLSAVGSLRNPTIAATVTVSGRSSKDGNTPVANTATINRTIQVGTNLALSSYASRTMGPFTNTGPIPPKANVETTYTILFDFTATVNSVAGATVRGVLPPYVRFVGSMSPNDGSITYDEATRTVTWAAGEVPAGTTGGAPERGAFQVALLPSFSQQGTSPLLMSSVSYSATDRFTKRLVEGKGPDVSTQTSRDSGFVSTQGEVAR
jgi:hypothetical protein